MKKILALLLSVILVMGMMVGCGGNNDQPEVEQPGVTDEVINDENQEATGEEENTEVEEYANDTYLAADADMSAYKEITSVAKTKFMVPADIYDNAIGMEEYIFGMLGAALSGLDEDATEEEVMANLSDYLDQYALEESAEAFLMINATNLSSVIVEVEENVDNLTIDDLTQELLNEMINAEDDETEPTDIEVEIEAGEDAPNTGSNTEDQVLLIDESATEINDEAAEITTDGEAAIVIDTDVTGVEDVTDEATTDEVTEDTEVTTEETTEAEEEVTELVVGEILAKSDDKIIVTLSGVTENADMVTGEPTLVTVYGYVTVVIKDGYIVTAAVMGDENADTSWFLPVIQSVTIDVTNEGMVEPVEGEEVVDDGVTDLEDVLNDTAVEGEDTTEEVVDAETDTVETTEVVPAN